ncbi:MAG: type I restriction enzyme S subunit [Roseivirga sp.]|jgi:type I restriction enzyme S subunit
MTNWKEINLGDAATFVNGYPFKPSDWSIKGDEIIRIQNLTKSSKEANYFEGEIAEKYKVRKGDLLISWSATLGIYEWEGEDAWLNQHIFKVVFNKKEFDKNFFKYLISYLLDELGQEVHGATMKHITKKKFDAVQIPFPPLATQKKIAAILDAADAHRQKTKQLLAKYEELAQSIFLEMFGDPVTNPKGWEYRKLDDSLKFMTSGSRGWAKHYSDTGSIFLRIQNIGYDELRLDDITYVNAPENAESKRTEVQSGDVILTITADLGRTAVIPMDFPKANINQHLALLRLKSIYNPVFVSSYIASKGGQSQFLKLDKGGVKAGLNFTDIRSFKVFSPPKDIQDSFAKRLESIENQKEQAKNSIEKANNLFNSLLQKAFKGELVN